MPHPVDVPRASLRDPALVAIADKLAAGERLDLRWRLYGTGPGAGPSTRSRARPESGRVVAWRLDRLTRRIAGRSPGRRRRQGSLSQVDRA